MPGPYKARMASRPGQASPPLVNVPTVGHDIRHFAHERTVGQIPYAAQSPAYGRPAATDDPRSTGAYTSPAKTAQPTGTYYAPPAQTTQPTGFYAPPSQVAQPSDAQPVRQQPPVAAQPIGKYNTQTQPVRAAKPKRSVGVRAVALILAIVITGTFLFTGYKYPGFLLKEKAGGEADVNTAEYTGIVKDLFESFGLTEEDFYAYLADPIEATPENSPGNPAFIEVSFTDAERASAPSQSMKVTRENPTAYFSDFGITIDLKWWNLENEEDTLTVKRLPSKTDAVTGMELYTYDYSLASGQHEFYTPVEVTVPIVGDPYAFEGVAYRNDETGGWETVYYELSEDGNNYIAHMTHFSDDAQLSTGADKIAKMKADGLSIQDFYKENGDTLFRIMPYQDLAKYPDSHTWLWGIGLTKMPNLEQFMRKQTAQSLKTYSDLMMETGGITTEAGEAEAYAALGGKADAASTSHFTISNTKLGKAIENMKYGGKVWSGAGHVLTVLGLNSLYWRIVDQVERGVSFKEIASSNGWNFVSAAASTTSLICGAILALGTTATVAATATAVSGVAAVVGAAVFFVTQAEALKVDYDLMYKPLGDPGTIEEGAYHYFLSDYAQSSSERPEETKNESAAAFAFLRVMRSDLTDYDKTHAPGYHSLDIRGNGWAFALDYLFKKYEKNPEKLASKVEKLYDDFLTCFWTDKGNNSGVKYLCWQYSAQRIIDEKYHAWDYSLLEELEGMPQVNEKGEYVDEYYCAVADYGEDEILRRVNIAKTLKDGRSINDLFDGKLDRELYVRFNKLTQSQIDAMTEKARGVLYKNTNAIVYGIYRKYYEENMRALSDRLYKKVLPWLNTRVTFYKRDLAQDVITSAETKYDMFQFVTDQQPLFDPSNAVGFPAEFGLNLYVREGTPVLLETNVYHYLRFGCPTEVVCKNSMREVPDLKGEAKWDSVNLTIDENSLWNALPEKYKSKGSDYAIRDMRVPIEYNAPKKFEITSTGANSPGSFPLSDDYLFSMVYYAFHEACLNADGKIDEKGNVSFSGKGTYEYDFNQKGKATVEFTATGTIDPKSKTGTCTVSGTGTIEDTDNDYNWMNHKKSRKVSVTFTGSGDMYGTLNGKSCVFEQCDEVRCTTKNTQFTFSGSYSGHDRLRDENISGDLNCEYTLDHYGGWGVDIKRK